MKDPYLLLRLAFFLCLLTLGKLSAQLCVVNSTDTFAVVLPSDTLEIDGSVLGSQVLQIVHPGDSIYIGYPLEFDSIVITHISGVPPGMSVNCHTTSPNCFATPDSTGFIRYCLTVSNTQPLGYNPSYPGYDSLELELRIYYWSPFLILYWLEDTLPIYYRIQNTDSTPPVGIHTISQTILPLYPNPARDAVNLSWETDYDEEYSLLVTDLMGKVVLRESLGLVPSGVHRRELDLSDWPAGAYLVTLRSGNRSRSSKLLKLDE